MIPSMFTLDHRLAELRPSPDDLRSTQLREAAAASARPARSIGETIRLWLVGATTPSRPSRLATHRRAASPGRRRAPIRP